MDRPPLGKKRPPPPQRTLSGSHALQHGLRRPPLPSRLSNVRSVSQPAHLVHSGPHNLKVESPNAAAFLSNQESFCTSPSSIKAENDEWERPAKRAKVDDEEKSESVISTFAGNADEEDRGELYTVLAGTKIPCPPRQTLSTGGRNANRGRTSTRESAARRAKGIEPPTMATKVPSPRHVLDFAPWHGSHPEDTMNETVIKGGHYDKAPPTNAREIESARANIWPNLSQKNNMVLSTLSYLFSSVLEKRQALGKCTAPSTFKPPPRVTVTDTKREAWLRDLANNDIPLRKQSRTIPHGVRGKLLMEQCVAKSIPMPRAVWLAQCVGANEMRAFRRKGVSGATAASGESKWVREWTIHVEQFLDGMVTACGQPGWKDKMDYAIKLVASFYSEHLIERQHFLDWIVESLASAELERLPIWIILAQIYWKDILNFVRRGRVFAEALLRNLRHIVKEDDRAFDALKIRLQKLIVVLAVSNRGCLVLPSTWSKYGHLLSPLATHSPAGQKADVDALVQNIRERNERVAGPLSKTPHNTRCALLDLYGVLDQVGLDFNLDALTSQCLAVVSDVGKLVPSLLDWCSSIYRTGVSRIYVAAKLVVKLNQDGHDTNSPIVDFLKEPPSQARIAENAHQCICEVLKANAFSVGRYFQWLMTSGMLTRQKNEPLATGLLRSIPVDQLAPHLANTLRMLLGRIGHQAGTSSLDEADNVLSEYLASDETDVTEPLGKVDALCLADKHALVDRLCAKAALKSKHQSLSLGQYSTLRLALEHCGDYKSLGSLLGVAIDSENTLLLASACDTLNLYAEILATTIQLPSLLDRMIERYRSLRSQQTLDRTLILSLRNLVERFPQQASFVQLLEGDLTICEQQNSMAVCSPASDNLVSMQSTYLGSDEDIDAVFASGNTMDEQLMQRVFARIVQRAGKSVVASTEAPSKICSWLNQLRSVDGIGFQQLVKEFVVAYLKGSADSEPASSLVTALVASACLDLVTVINLAKASGSADAALLVLSLLTGNEASSGLHVTEKFRFNVWRQGCVRNRAEDVMRLIALAMDSQTMSSIESAIAGLMTTYAATHPQAWIMLLDKSRKRNIFTVNYRSVVMRCLQSDEHANNLPNSGSIVALAHPLSIYHCTRMLELVVTDDSDGEPDRTALQEAILKAIEGGCEVWPQLLEKAGRRTTNAVYQWAQEQVLQGLEILREPMDAQGSAVVKKRLDRNLEILDVSRRAAEEDDRTAFIATLMEKLKNVEGAGMLEHKGGDSSLHTLLHLCALHGTSEGQHSEALQQAQGTLLVTLCSLLAHPAILSHPDRFEHVFDVASLLVDTLAAQADLSALLPRNILVLAKRHPHIASLIGYRPSPDAWLTLVSNPLPGLSAPANPHPPRALMKQATQKSTPQRQGSISSQSATPRLSTISTKERDGQPKLSTPFVLRRWEMIPDAAPVVGENDAALGMGLFRARKV